LFGLMHLNVVQVFYAAVLGYIMALAVLATRSIWTAIIIHFINNAFAAYFTFAIANGWFLGNIFGHFGELLMLLGNVLGMLLYVGVFAGLFVVIMRIIHKFARENYIKDHVNDENFTPISPKFKGFTAIKFYLTANMPRHYEKLRPLEATLICGIVFLGLIITGMTLAWGFF